MTQRGARRKRLLIVDQNLLDAGGHYAEYTLAVARAARAQGLTVDILANLRCKVAGEPGINIVPVFRNSWIVAQRAQQVFPTNLIGSFDPWTFYADLQKGLDTVEATRSDDLFIHTIGFGEVEDVLRLLMMRNPASCPRVHLLLRRDPIEVDDDAEQRRVFYRSLRALYQLGFLGDRIWLYTDTDELTEAYSKATKLPFITLAIPFDLEMMENALGRGAPFSRTREIIVGYLGDARPEKGYQFLPALVEALGPRYLETGRVRFVFQSNFNLPGGEPGIATARAQLDRYGAAQVELLVEPLTQNEYYRRLAELDILIIPYLAHRYTCRSSGIFAQALAAGKIVVVPDGTSMSNVLKKQPPEAGVVYANVSEIADATAQAIESAAERIEVLEHTRHEWCASNTADALVETLISRKSDSTGRPPLVLILLDGDSMMGTTGAGFVQANQLTYLNHAGYRTAAVCLLRTYPMSEQYPRLYRAIERIWEDNDLGFAWMAHHVAPFKESKPGLANEVARNANLSVPDSLAAMCARGAFEVILVNYATGLPYLDLLQLPPETPCAVETHDIQSIQYAMNRGELIDPVEYSTELGLLSRADAIVAINPSEGRRLRADMPKHHVFTVIPSKFDPPSGSFDLAGAQDLGEIVSSARSDLEMVDFSRAELTGQTHQLKALQSTPTIDLFYVSSIHPPNLRGFEWFFEKVFAPHLAPAGVTLLVAGAYSETKEMRDRAERFPKQVFLAGRVGSLRPLYAAARVVIAPVFDGAGTNIKVVEALAAGKPLVATSYAVRGLASRDEFQCFDDPAGWVTYIKALLADREKRREAAKRCLAVADPRRARQKYYDQYDAVFRTLLGSGAPSGAEKIETQLEMSYEFIEWDRDRVEPYNRLLRRLLEEGVLDRALAGKVADLTATDEGANNFERIVYALLVDRTAPIYSTQSYIGKALVRLDLQFESALQAFWAFILRATPNTALEPVGPKALAGCQNLGEVLSACGSSAAFVDIERAYGAGLLDIQFKRAVDAATFDLAILCDDATGQVSPAALRAITTFVQQVFLPRLAPTGATLVLIGDVPESLGAHPGVFLTGKVATPTPVLAASKLIVLPFDEGCRWDAGSIQAALRAMAAGKPLVGWRSIGRAIPDVAGWVAEADDNDMLETIIRDLLADADARVSAAKLVGKTFASFHALSMPDKPAWQGAAALPLGHSALEPSAPLLEWSPPYIELGRMINLVARDEAIRLDEIRSCSENWQGPMQEVASALVRAVCADRTAPLARTSYRAFQEAGRSRLGRIGDYSDLVVAAEQLAQRYLH